MHGHDYERAKDLTLGELSVIAESIQERDMERERAEWERTRWLATVLLSPHLRKGKTMQPRDLVVFPWEKQERTEADDAAAAAKLAELFAQWDNDIEQKYGVQ